MVIISKKKLIEFYTKNASAKEVLLVWYHQVLLCNWKNIHELKQDFNSADYIGNDRVVFNIGGNKYRLVALIFYSTRTLYIKFIGTHNDYNKIDCKNI